MRKILEVIAAIPLFALVAAATDVPRAETFLGYNFVRFNPNSGFIPSFNANGGSGAFVYNVNKWIGGEVELGAVTKGTLNSFNVDTTVFHFVAGPRFTYRNHTRYTPFVHALFGGAYATASSQISLLGGTVLPLGLPIDQTLPVTARLNASNTGFAMFVGGGLDIKFGKHIAFRPAGADYYLTRVTSIFGGTTNRNNFRYAAGVNFLFGAQ